MTDSDLIYDGPATAPVAIILAHGAGKGMDSPFMQYFAESLAASNVRVIRFEFPYMNRARQRGKRLPPDRMPVLLDAYKDVIQRVRKDLPDHVSVVIGGKSMGGRVASMVLEESCASGVVCLGYPFHPPGKPEKLRVEHLYQIKKKVLFVQGERDTFGKREEVAQYNLPSHFQLAWMTDGDHGFKPRKASGRSEQENWDAAVSTIQQFLSTI
ncbi:MAG: alpha/beta fold hydrolase [Pirellulaceae bacterium]